MSGVGGDGVGGGDMAVVMGGKGEGDAVTGLDFGNETVLLY